MVAACRRISVALVAAALLAGCAETYRANGPRPEGNRGSVSRGTVKAKEKSNNGQKRGHNGQRGRGRGNGRGNN